MSVTEELEFGIGKESRIQSKFPRNINKLKYVFAV
jgi:hypothetical protein